MNKNNLFSNNQLDLVVALCKKALPKQNRPDNDVLRAMRIEAYLDKKPKARRNKEYRTIA